MTTLSSKEGVSDSDNKIGRRKEEDRRKNIHVIVKSPKKKKIIIFGHVII